MAAKSKEGNAAPKRTLTFYLLKEGCDSEATAIRADPAVRTYLLQVSPDLTLSLFVRPRPAQRPKWVSFFSDYVDPDAFGFINSAAAVLLVPAASRFVAFTFGQGRFLLAPDVWEERFGLKVVLNSIGENQLRSVDKETIHAIPLHAREQTGRDASAFDFGLDVERDLLRAVTGTPSPSSLGLGTSLTGMDALRTHLPISIVGLPDLAERCLLKSEATSYQETFPWVDHLSEVSNGETRAALDELLIDRLREESPTDVWLAYPGVVNWNSTRGFRYGNSSRDPEHFDLHIQKMLHKLQGWTTLEALHKNRITCIGDDGNEKDEASFYRCIQCELDFDRESFLLSTGRWYRIETDFVNGVNNFYDKIEKAKDLALPAYDDDSETIYNARVAATQGQRFAPMDNKLVAREAGRGKIEFCDLFSFERDIIHVKRYGGSSPLSHLFAQGHVSGSAFAGDPVFREEVSKKLPIEFRHLAPKERPEANSYRVVFAIVSQSEKPLRLPLFSRLSLRHATRELRAYGFRVAVAKIDVAELRRKNETRRGKPRKTF